MSEEVHRGRAGCLGAAVLLHGHPGNNNCLNSSKSDGRYAPFAVVAVAIVNLELLTL